MQDSLQSPIILPRYTMPTAALQRRLEQLRIRIVSGELAPGFRETCSPAAAVVVRPWHDRLIGRGFRHEITTVERTDYQRLVVEGE